MKAIYLEKNNISTVVNLINKVNKVNIDNIIDTDWIDFILRLDIEYITIYLEYEKEYKGDFRWDWDRDIVDDAIYWKKYFRKEKIKKLFQ